MTAWQRVAERIRRVATAKGRDRFGCFSIEGIRLHERALRAGIIPEQVIIAQNLWHTPPPRVQSLLTALQTAACPVHPIPDTAMADITQGRARGDILGLIKMPPPPDLAELAAIHPQPLLLAAVDVVDPGNVGALVRTGHASGIAAFIAIGVSDPFHPKAVRTAMGSLFKVPICRYATVSPVLTLLQAQQIETVGAAAGQGTPLPQAAFGHTGTAVFMGNEYQGLPDNHLAQMDKHVTIPMTAGIDSFSVNAAAAIILYEIRRNHVND